MIENAGMWDRYPEVGNEIDEIEKIIIKNIKSRNSLLTKICRELTNSGGKRIRPAFAVIASRFGSYDDSKVRNLAAALEILHTATLVHDDVIDRAVTRRGKVTVAAEYGVDMAIYTGDFMFTRAVMMLTSNISAGTDMGNGSFRPDMAAKAIKTICEGEVDQYIQKFDTDISAISYLKRIYRKTAILFGAACALGALSAGCSPETVRLLGKFGLYYGMAFQIRDDLNDFISEEKVEGKPVIKDIAEGIFTLPVIYAVTADKNVRKFMEKLSQQSNKKINSSDIAKAVEMVKGNGGIARSRGIMNKYITKGSATVGRLPRNQYTGILNEMLISIGFSIDGV